MSKSIKWDDADGAASNARIVLPKLVTEYFAEVRRVLATNPTPPELHQLRLASKHFRYTLELFRPCYAAGLEQRIKALKRVQDILGVCNDAVASAAHIDRALRTNSAEKARMRGYLQTLAERNAAEFREYWTKEFD